MNTEKRKLKKLLYRSFDAELSEREQRVLNEGLKKFPDLATEKEAVSSLRSHLSQQEGAFSGGFEKKIMSRIQRHGALISAFTIKPTFRAVALSGVAAILVVLISVYFIDGSLSIDSLMGINSYNPDLGMLTFF